MPETYKIRAFRGYDSHKVIILGAAELPPSIARGFKRAAGRFNIPLGFAQDAEEFDYTPTAEDLEPTPAPPVRPRGELWQECDARGCDIEPVCVTCYKCHRHCQC